VEAAKEDFDLAFETTSTDEAIRTADTHITVASAPAA
jgi:hypothetical protein